MLFAFGTVALRSPLGLPPLTATAWQLVLGCVPMVVVGMLLEAPDPAALSLAGSLLTPVVGVVAAAIALGEPFGCGRCWRWA